MSHLLARIMLALLMLPLATVVYVTTAVILFETTGGSRTVAPFAVAGVLTATFVALYWFRLWRRTIIWTPERTQMTIGTAIGALTCGVVAGAIGTISDTGFGLFLGGVVAILVWLLFTVLVWRETTEERMARVRAGANTTIVCPGCGYNMTGLNLATCPECGATFSIDELVAAQPDREQAEIEPGPDPR